jgi:hypothetical protein
MALEWVEGVITKIVDEPQIRKDFTLKYRV